MDLELGCAGEMFNGAFGSCEGVAARGAGLAAGEAEGLVGAAALGEDSCFQVAGELDSADHTVAAAVVMALFALRLPATAGPVPVKSITAWGPSIATAIGVPSSMQSVKVLPTSIQNCHVLIAGINAGQASRLPGMQSR